MAAVVDIASLVPHAGRMVLLDEVVAWGAARICCRSASHRRADNPLRREGRLSAATGLEYGAQAAAVHAALNGRAGDGFLAAARDLTWTCAYLDDIDADLVVTATPLVAESRMIVYRFRIDAGAPGSEETEGARACVSGQLTISLRDSVTRVSEEAAR